MKQLSILNWIVFGVGAAILFLIFFMFLHGAMPDNVFWLDLVVTLIAYALVYVRAVQPMVDFDDPARRQVSFLGLSFVSIGLYAGVAVLAMIVMHLGEVQFKNQLLVQILLAFLLLISFMVGARMSDKTVEVFNQEQRTQGQLDNLRRVLTRLERTAACTPGLPGFVKGRIGELKEQIRYIAPCDNLEATDLEVEMTQKATFINGLCSDHEANGQAIDQALTELEHMLRERKAIYST